MIEATWTPHKKKSLLDPRTKLLLILVESVLDEVLISQPSEKEDEAKKNSFRCRIRSVL